jgi:hypothetical protein
MVELIDRSLGNPSVIQRIRELQENAVQSAGITVEGLIEECAKAQTRALELGQMSAFACSIPPRSWAHR